MFDWLRRRGKTDSHEDEKRLISLRAKFRATQYQHRTESPSRPMLTASELGELVEHGLISQLEANQYDTGSPEEVELVDVTAIGDTERKYIDVSDTNVWSAGIMTRTAVHSTQTLRPAPGSIGSCNISTTVPPTAEWLNWVQAMNHR